MQRRGRDPIRGVIEQLDAVLSQDGFAEVWLALLERRAVEDPVCRNLLDRLQGTHHEALLHDVRSLLTPISLGVRTVQRLLPHALDNRDPCRQVIALTELEEALDGAREASKTLGELLRSESPLPDNTECPITPVAPVIRSTVRALQTSPARIVITDAQPVRAVILDHDLQRILLNLTTNALKATANKADGRVRVSCRETDRVEIEVEDNGCGIPAADRERIFDLFWSGDEAGNGVGLYVCRQLALRWEGTIRVRSKPGQTIFTLSLPLASDLVVGEVRP